MFTFQTQESLFFSIMETAIDNIEMNSTMLIVFLERFKMCDFPLGMPYFGPEILYQPACLAIHKCLFPDRLEAPWGVNFLPHNPQDALLPPFPGNQPPVSLESALMLPVLETLFWYKKLMEGSKNPK